MPRSIAPQEKERLRQLLACQRRCSIHLRLQRRPLPSRPGSKGAVPSRGRAAHPRARMNNIGQVNKEKNGKHGPLCTQAAFERRLRHHHSSDKMQALGQGHHQRHGKHRYRPPIRRKTPSRMPKTTPLSGCDTMASPPPNPRIWGFHPGIAEGGEWDVPQHHLQRGRRHQRCR
jgi:hypothetical protein